MKKMKLVHKRRMINAMREFIINANDLTYEDVIDEQYFYKDEEISLSEYLKKFRDEATREDLSTIRTYDDFNYKVSIKQDDCFCRYPDVLGEKITIGYNLNSLMEKDIYGFYKNMYQRSKITKGFANITLTLLHEIGHAETEDEIRETFSYEDRHETREHNYNLIEKKYGDIDKTDKNYNQFIFELNELYRQMPDEHAATDWAIQWLENADNRKIAKKFEKKFFSCFEGA